MVPTEFRTNLSKLHGALGDGSHTAWREAAEAGYPGEFKTWYGQALSSLLVLLGDEPIEYLNVRGALDDSGYVAQAEIFTDSLMVSVDSRAAQGVVDPRWRVGAVSLEGLREVSVAASGQVFTSSVDAEWPRVVSAELTFESGLVVPLVPSGVNSEHRKALAEYVRVLVAGLS